MRFDAVVVGGGMITHDQLLPSLYQLRRLGSIGSIKVCARNCATLDRLRTSETLCRAFPDQTFEPATEPYENVLTAASQRQLAVVAVPDPLHRDVIMAALGANLHICSVKPLVMTSRESIMIETEAHRRGVFIGIDYHKRFDDRSLIARRLYREGDSENFAWARHAFSKNGPTVIPIFKTGAPSRTPMHSVMSDAIMWIWCSSSLDSSQSQ